MKTLILNIIPENAKIYAVESRPNLIVIIFSTEKDMFTLGHGIFKLTCKAWHTDIFTIEKIGEEFWHGENCV